VLVLPGVILVVELLLVWVLVVVGALARVVLRRPWTVAAVNLATGERHSWKVVGWRASGIVVGRAAEALVAGVPPGDHLGRSRARRSEGEPRGEPRLRPDAG
jgi:hypothetical protein